MEFLEEKKINLILDIWWGKEHFEGKKIKKKRKPHPLVRLQNKIITHLRR